MILDLLQEPRQFHRLGIEVVAARGQRPFAILNERVGGQGDDRDRPRRRRGFDVARRLQAVHEIAVRLALHNGHVEATVEDDGKPFDPLAAPAPNLTSSPREIGGVGLHFVRNLTDEQTYTRRDHINQLRLIKRLGQETGGMTTGSTAWSNPRFYGAGRAIEPCTAAVAPSALGRPKPPAESGADIAKNGPATQRSKMPGIVGFSGCRRQASGGAPAGERAGLNLTS